VRNVTVADRLFTVDEVNDLIPRLEQLMARLQRRGAELRDAVQLAMRERSGGEDPIPVAELLRLRPEVEPAARDMEALLREIEAIGGEFKGLDLGLVDFAAEIDGEAVLLCWQYGEAEVGFYHSANDGFAGRKPLPRSRPRVLQ
jgi:hypothetical protein